MTTWDPRQDALRHDDLGRALQALPLAKAPHTLAPRVMAAIAAGLTGARRDYTWFDWPGWAQGASACLLLGLTAVVAVIWPSATSSVAQLLEADVFRLADLIWRVWQPMALGVCAVLTGIVLMCATFGALLGRVALGGASR